MALVYLKHKHSSTLYLLTNDKEYQISLNDGSITKRGRHTTRNADKLLDKANYNILGRRAFLAQLTINGVQLSQELLTIINVQLRIKFEYKLM